MNKAQEILNKHTKLNDVAKDTFIDFNFHKAIIDAINEAINYTRCCKSDSEQLKVFIDKDVDIDLVSGQKCRLLKYTEESFLIQYNHNDQIEWVGVSDLKVENL